MDARAVVFRAVTPRTASFTRITINCFSLFPTFIRRPLNHRRDKVISLSPSRSFRSHRPPDNNAIEFDGLMTHNSRRIGSVDGTKDAASTGLQWRACREIRASEFPRTVDGRNARASAFQKFPLILHSAICRPAAAPSAIAPAVREFIVYGAPLRFNARETREITGDSRANCIDDHSRWNARSSTRFPSREPARNLPEVFKSHAWSPKRSLSSRRGKCPEYDILTVRGTLSFVRASKCLLFLPERCSPPLAAQVLFLIGIPSGGGKMAFYFEKMYLL